VTVPPEQPSWQPPSWQPPAGGQPPPPPPPSYGTPSGLPGYDGYGQQGYPGYPPPYPGYQQPYAVAAPKPGIIPLRPLAVGEILDGAFSTIRRHPKATLGLAAAVACVQQGLGLSIRFAAGTLTTGSRFSNNGNIDGTDVGALVGGTLGTLVISAILTALLTGVLCLIVSDSILGQPTSAGSAWSRARPQAMRLLGVSLLVALGEVVGLVLCIIPGVFLWGAWALAVPALVLERTTVSGAMRRSWRLATSSWWRVFGIRLLAWFVATVLTGLLTSVAGASSLRDAFNTSGTTTPHLSTITIVLTAVLTVLATTLTAPFLAGVETLLYVDRRIRLEALDVQLQQAAAAQTTAFG
jgi:hypothetical protein